MTDWNFADIFEAIAGKLPDAPCQRQGERAFTWADFSRRADGVAADLLEAGLGQQAKVAVYTTNCPEYLEAYFAAFKAGLAPVNTNFRYGPEEIRYLFDNADAEAVVFHARFTPVLEQVRESLGGVKRWYVVDDGTPGPRPGWAVPYEEVASRPAAAEPVRAPWGRSGDDLLLLYTGGTTGMPKGVMWRQDDLFRVLGGGGNLFLGQPPAASMDELLERLGGPGLSMLPACPLMHGTGQFSAFVLMALGGSVVLLETAAFDPAELWRTVERYKVNVVVIVGDAFAKPMVAELDAHPDAYDLSSLVLMSSSGVMWSQDTKRRLLEHIPQIVLSDQFSSSEAIGLAASTSMAGKADETATFKIGERVQVFTEDGRPVEPGSDRIGLVAITGYLPVGYYKDPEKTARTFRTFDGVRYSTPGDYATVDADGTLHLLGRGSVVINTGGEKVFPEEVEEVIKQHPSVRDAVCVGIPDDRFGETVCAVVEPEPGAQVDPDAIIAAVRAQLAHYKAPRRIVIEPIRRSPSGKVDYKGLQALAQERAGVQE